MERNAGCRNIWIDDWNEIFSQVHELRFSINYLLRCKMHIATVCVKSISSAVMHSYQLLIFRCIYNIIDKQNSGFIKIIFTALHGMQTWSTMRILSVCPSVRLSVCRTRALWSQNGRKLCLDFYIIQKNIYPSFLRRMVGGKRPLLPEILGQPTPVGAKSPILNR